MIVTVTTELEWPMALPLLLSAEPKYHTDPNVPKEGTAKEMSNEHRGFIHLTGPVPVQGYRRSLVSGRLWHQPA